MYLKLKKESFFIIGTCSLTLAILLDRFGGQFIFKDFFEGVFTGISLVMNIFFLVRFGRERRMRLSENQVI
jgi:hypothetical protein